MQQPELLDQDRPLEVIEGIITEIIFRNEQNDYTVCTLTDDTVVVGVLPFIHPGESVRLFGSWKVHPDYGRQYSVQRYELMAPQSTEAMLFYLSSGLIKGMGEKTAARLIRAFGEKTLDTIRDQPDQIAALKGISRDKALQFSNQLKEKEDYQELMLLLGPLDVGTGTILRIYRQYGRQALDVLAENPYALADDVHGIGFLTADRLARKLGLDPYSTTRIACAIRFILGQSVNHGHTAMPVDECLKAVSQLVEQDIGRSHPALAMLTAGDHIMLISDLHEQDQSQLMVLPQLYHTEKSAAERVGQLTRSQPRHFAGLDRPESVRRKIEQKCRQQKMELASEQIEALVQTYMHPLSILTGGPGTGKTTIIKLLCDCMSDQGGRILLAAPTGRAARRMSEAAGRPAKTLHRLLEIGFNHQQAAGQADEQPNVELNCDLLIVDESSMMDIFLFRSLLSAVSAGTRLLLVGDADQLPSVGPGYVLKDLIDSQQIPVTRLTRIFRQAAESLIIRNAHRIHDGQWPILDQSINSQFLVVYKDNAEQMATAVSRLCTEILPREYQLDVLQDVQVLTPMRKGPAGCNALNQALQKLLADPENQQPDRTLISRGQRFGEGDKVMQIRNNYELSWQMVSDGANTKGQGVFNGETGTVQQVCRNESTLNVLFDDERLVGYDANVIDDLDLAYAMTIHKSQGSEYPVVILVIPAGSPQLLTRNLLYTAVTRARERIILISTKRTLAGMLANQTAYTRHTLLKYWLNQGVIADPGNARISKKSGSLKP